MLCRMVLSVPLRGIWSVINTSEDALTHLWTLHLIVGVSNGTVVVPVTVPVVPVVIGRTAGSTWKQKNYK